MIIVTEKNRRRTTLSSLYGHITALLIDESIDEHIQDISIEPSDEVTEVVTRGTADWSEPIGPLKVAVTFNVQYPRVGTTVDYWDLFTKRSTFRVAWVDCDGKRGAAENCRIVSAPRIDPQKGERKQDVKIQGFLVNK